MVTSAILVTCLLAFRAPAASDRPLTATAAVTATRGFALAVEEASDLTTASRIVRTATVLTTQTLILRMTDANGVPASGVDLTPLLVSQPEGADRGLSFSPIRALTDAAGLVRFDFRFNNTPGRYEVLIFQGKTVATGMPFHRVEFQVHRENWATILLFTLLGGLAVFLYAMLIMSDGLQALAGRRLRTALGELTRSQFSAFLIGIAVTFLTQSSGATTVMVMSFIRAKLLSLRNSLAIIYGAAVAGTITVQLISLDLFVYAPPAIAAGFALHFFSGRSRVKAAGTALLGFGFLFLGIKIMTDALAPLKAFPFFKGAVDALAGHPVWGVLLSGLFTAATQSSGAVLGVVLALARQDLISLPEAVPMFFGAGIGACFTGLYASFGAPADARRIAWAHLVFKVAGVLLFLPLVTPLADLGSWLTYWITTIPAGTGEFTSRAIANTYTLYIFITALIALPLSSILERFVMAWIPDRPEKGNGDVRTKYLDPNLFDTPAIAIGSVQREISRMGRFVEEMMKQCAAGLFEKKTGTADFIHTRDNKVDALNTEITRYLNRLAAHTQNAEESEQVTALLYIVSDIESVGDIVDKNLVPLVEKMISRDYAFSEEGAADLRALHARVSERVSQMVIALATSNHDAAEDIVQGFEGLQAEGKLLHLRHLKRLQSELPESVETSSVHLDVINYLLRIDYLVFNICLHITGRARQPVVVDAS